VSEQAASWIGSLMPLAALVGGLVGGPLLESVGRKRTILLTAFPFMLASLLVAHATAVLALYVGRAVTGFCIGVISLSLPVYLAEAVHPEVRGTLGLLPTTLGNGGVMLCYVLGFFLDWSQLSLFGAVIPLPFLLLMCLIPETPR
jgi:facilitated trehalose transporter